MIRRGPTLVEVMIALVMLGMLAVVLFPAWAAARARRNATTCAGNLQHIYRAFSLYQSDWDEQLPPHRPTWTWDRGQNSYIWPELAGYGLSIRDCRCPNRDLLNLGEYDFRLDLGLPFVASDWQSPGVWGVGGGTATSPTACSAIWVSFR